MRVRLVEAYARDEPGRRDFITTIQEITMSTKVFVLTAQGWIRRCMQSTCSCLTAVTAIAAIAGGAPAFAAPSYEIKRVLVAEDQWKNDPRVTPKPLFKPHETDATHAPGYWISSNERGEEEGGAPVPSKAGITVFETGTNAVLSTVFIEGKCLPVINPDGSAFGCAPQGAEGHPRHPHGIDIDEARKLAYQVIEHSGLKWNQNRTGFLPAETTDEESGLLLVYDIRDPRNPTILAAYVAGHAAEEVAVNGSNGKAYVGNHEPSPGVFPTCFVSVVDRNKKNSPYKFIDLPDTDCVQGIAVDGPLDRINGTTHIGEKMYTFKSSNDTIDYAVDIRGPFLTFFGPIPAGYVVHMHDLATDPVNHRAYQSIHTLAPAVTSEGEEETAAEEITGRWVAEVNTDPRSRNFKKVRIIDLSNGQSARDVPTHNDARGPFEKRFVHAHFLAVDPLRKSLLVSGEHTGNLGVVDTESGILTQVLAISRPIPGCVPPPNASAGRDAPEPHVHGVNVQSATGRVYVSDEGENCYYESVTILRSMDGADDEK